MRKREKRGWRLRVVQKGKLQQRRQRRWERVAGGREGGREAGGSGSGSHAMAAAAAAVLVPGPGDSSSRMMTKEMAMAAAASASFGKSATSLAAGGEVDPLPALASYTFRTSML